MGICRVNCDLCDDPHQVSLQVERKNCRLNICLSCWKDMRFRRLADEEVPLHSSQSQRRRRAVVR
jgi:hypothetical protein